MSKNFKIGDVVELKSGGPKMTIVQIKQQYEDGKAIDGFNCYCKWFVDDKPESHQYDQLALKLVED